MKRIVFFLALIACWATVYELRIVPAHLLPGPGDVLGSLLHGLATGVLVEALLASLRRLAIGFGLALAAGLLLGALLARSALARELLGPLVSAFQAVPSIAWLPLTILWLGLSESAIICIVFLGSVWSVACSTEAGLRSVPPILVKAGRNMGASSFPLFVDVILPAAFPEMLSGWRLAWAFSWRSLMAAELVASSKGLGAVLMVSRNAGDMASVIAVILIVGAVGAVVDSLVFRQMENRIRRKRGLALA